MKGEHRPINEHGLWRVNANKKGLGKLTRRKTDTEENNYEVKEKKNAIKREITVWTKQWK